jgi:hypothetical protein
MHELNQEFIASANTWVHYSISRPSKPFFYDRRKFSSLNTTLIQQESRLAEPVEISIDSTLYDSNILFT